MVPYVEEPNEASLTAPSKRAPDLVAPEPGMYCGNLILYMS